MVGNTRFKNIFFNVSSFVIFERKKLNSSRNHRKNDYRSLQNLPEYRICLRQKHIPSQEQGDRKH